MEKEQCGAAVVYFTAVCAAFGTLSYLVAVILSFFSVVRLTAFHHLFGFFLIFCSSLLHAFCIGTRENETVNSEKRAFYSRDARRAFRKTFLFLTAIYAFMLICLTLFDPSFGRTGFLSFKEWANMTPDIFWARVNFVPFKTVMRFVRAIGTSAVSVRAIVINLLGNLCVFMPLAFLAPAGIVRLRRFWAFFVSITAFVAFIELSQLILLTGMCDIDDLILNVGGACVFYALVKIPPIYNKIIP